MSASFHIAAIRSASAGFERSATQGVALRPVSCAMAWATASNRSAVRATRTTSQPSRARLRAMAAPIPFDAPVTKASLPSRARSISGALAGFVAHEHGLGGAGSWIAPMPLAKLDAAEELASHPIEGAWFLE